MPPSSLTLFSCSHFYSMTFSVFHSFSLSVSRTHFIMHTLNYLPCVCIALTVQLVFIPPFPLSLTPHPPVLIYHSQCSGSPLLLSWCVRGLLLLPSPSPSPSPSLSPSPQSVCPNLSVIE